MEASGHSPTARTLQGCRSFFEGGAEGQLLCCVPLVLFEKRDWRCGGAYSDRWERPILGRWSIQFAGESLLLTLQLGQAIRDNADFGFSESITSIYRPRLSEIKFFGCESPLWLAGYGLQPVQKLSGPKPAGKWPAGAGHRVEVHQRQSSGCRQAGPSGKSQGNVAKPSASRGSLMPLHPCTARGHAPNSMEQRWLPGRQSHLRPH